MTAKGRDCPHRRPGDDTLVAYLARGATYGQAAEAASVSAKTVQRRMAEPEFRAAVDAERTAIRRRTSDQLAAMTGTALAALTELLQSPNDPTRLAAVRLVIEGALRYGEAVDLRELVAAQAARIDAIEAEARGGPVRLAPAPTVAEAAA